MEPRRRRCRRPGLLLLLLLLLRAVESVDVRTEEEVEEEERGRGERSPEEEEEKELQAGGEEQQVTPAPEPLFLLKLRVVDAVSGQAVGGVSVTLFVNFTHTSTALSGNGGEAWFRVQPGLSSKLGPGLGSAVSVLATHRRYVPALLPVTVNRMPVFSSVTVPLLRVNRGNMWLFNDSVFITSKSSGVFGARPVVQFPRSALNLLDDGALSDVAAFMNSPSLSPPGGAFLRTMGLVSSKSGSAAVVLSPVASAFVKISSSSSDSEDFDILGPVSLSLSLSESSGLQDGAHIPGWTLNTSSGVWMRRGLGTVQSVDGTLVWTFAAPHLGHWMAAPLSPPTGETLELHVDFLLRHGAFLMMVLGSTLTVAVCLLIGLLCCPRSNRKDPKLPRPAVNPLFHMKDQSTSTSEDRAQSRSDGEYSVDLYDAQIGQKENVTAVTLDGSDEMLPHLAAQSLGNGFFFYERPVTVLHAPGLLHAPALLCADEDRCKPASPGHARRSEDSDKEQDKHAAKTLAATARAHSGLSGSVSEPGTLGKTGPRAWFVSLEGKPAAEIRYAVCEEQRRSRVADSRETSLDSGLDLTEPGQSKPGQERKLERNATFVKKSRRPDEAPQ